MWQCSIEPRTRKYVKGYEFLSLAKKIYKIIIVYRARFFKRCFQKSSP